MANSDFLKNAGDVNVEELTLIKDGRAVNLLPQMVELYLYENILSPFMNGELIVVDSVDLINSLPLRGQEILKLKLRTPGLEAVITGTFSVYLVSDRIQINDKTTAYKLSFASYEMIAATNVKLFKTYSGLISDIVKDIMIKDDALHTTKRFKVENAVNSTKFNVPNWNPIKCMTFLAPNAKNANNSSTFMFFENRAGFNFVSLDSLIAEPPRQTFVIDKFLRDVNSDGSTQANPDKDWKRILTLEGRNRGDHLEATQSGAYQSRQETFDIVGKRYCIQDYDYTKNFKKGNYLNPLPFKSDTTPSAPDSVRSWGVKQFNNYDGYGDVTNFDTAQERKSRLNLLNINTMEIEVLGRLDYAVGMTVMTHLERPQPLGASDTDNITEDSKWLVTALCHKIDLKRHTCKLKLGRDSR